MDFKTQDFKNVFFNVMNNTLYYWNDVQNAFIPLNLQRGGGGGRGPAGPQGPVGPAGGGGVPFAVNIDFVSDSGSGITLIANPIGGTGPFTYAWEVDSYVEDAALDIQISGSVVTQTVLVASVSPGTARGMLGCTVTDANGQIQRAEFWVQFNNGIPPIPG